MSPIPRPVMDRTESDANFEKHLKAPSSSNTKVMAIELIDRNTFIGIAAYLKNNNNQDEIGYRLREQFWGVGYGTETTKGLIDNAFNSLELEILTSDVNSTNVNSVKILGKFFTRYFEFYNEEDQCTDRRYKLKKEDWKNSIKNKLDKI